MNIDDLFILNKQNGELMAQYFSRGKIFSPRLVEFFRSFFSNTEIPAVLFNAPDDFISSFLKEYFKHNGYTGSSFIRLITPSNIFVQGLCIFLNRFGIQAKIDSNILYMRGQFANKFANLVGETITYPDEYNIENDTIRDPIVSITTNPSESNQKVYDLTVPATDNFGLYNGLQVFDTSDTGYLQRKLIKSMEDVRISTGNYTENNNGQILQFVYGNDSIDGCFLEKNTIKPIVIDDPNLKELLRTIKMPTEETEYLVPFSVHRILQKHIKVSSKKSRGDYQTMLGYFMSFMDSGLIVNKILSLFETSYTNPSKVVVMSLLNPQTVLDEHPSITNEIYASILTEIKNRWFASIVEPGEPVGPLAVQAIGESLTQLSVRGDTKVVVNIDGNTKIINIGDFIDGLLKINEQNVITTHITGDGLTSNILQISENMNITVPGVNKTEQVVFEKLTEVSRHPVAGGLVKIVTRTGREITCTLSHSFLTRKNNEVVPIKGSELVVGTPIPIISKLECNVIKNSINLIDYIDPSRFIIKYNLIYSKHNSIKDNCGIPAIFVLDEFFGYFMGQVLSDSNIHKHSNNILIFNTECSYIERTKQFCDKYSINYHQTYHNSDDKYGTKKYYKLLIFSRLFTDLCRLWTGTNHKDKHIPEWTLNAPKDFLKGLLTAYFDGDGCISIDKNKRSVLEATASSKELLNGIGLLLTRFNIISNINKSKKLYYRIRILSKCYKLFQNEIGFHNPYKKNMLTEVLSIGLKNSHGSDVIDKIYSFGDILSNIATKLYMKNDLNLAIKNDSIGRSSLEKYIPIMEEKAKVLSVDISTELTILKQSIDSGVLWDTVKEIEYIYPEGNEYVYDFSVRNIESFSSADGLIIHNTLNTFHSAGIASQTGITAGIPRFRELINVSKNPKSSLINIEVMQEYNKSEETVNIMAEYCRSTNITDILDTISVYYDRSFVQPINYFVKEPEKIDCPWVIELKFCKNSLYSNKISMNTITNVLWIIKNKYKIHTSINQNTIYCQLMKPNEFNYDNIRYIIDELYKIKINGVSYVESAEVLVDSKTKKCTIVASGGKLEDIMMMPFVDQCNTTSNNICDVLDYLGIEATRYTLSHEINKLLEGNGVHIAKRHIDLVADKITSCGVLIAFDRHGIRKSGNSGSPGGAGNSGILSCCSFEESVDTLAKAAVFSISDYLDGITASLMLGQIAKMGTHLNEVVVE
jgi:DNA-directed RNA polymerase subunit A"